MPTHLDQIDIEALEISDGLSKWISGKDHRYAPSSEPNLEKCTAKELDEETEHLRHQAAARLYADSMYADYDVGKIIHMAANGTLTA